MALLISTYNDKTSDVRSKIIGGSCRSIIIGNSLVKNLQSSNLNMVIPKEIPAVCNRDIRGSTIDSWQRADYTVY